MKIDERAFRWEPIDALAVQFKRQIRPIFMTIDFVTTDIEKTFKYDIEDILQTFIKNGTKRNVIFTQKIMSIPNVY
nr:hypothetical protein [Bacillus cereus]